MSPDLAVAALGSLYALPGFGILALAGIRIQWISPGAAALDILKLLGLAYLLGLVATSLALIALLCIGVPLSLVSLLLVSLTLGAGGILIDGRRRQGAGPARHSPSRSWTKASRLERWLGVLLLVGLAAYLYAGFRWAKVYPLAGSWDAWAMWVHKGELLYVFEHIPISVFTSSPYGYMHPDYPMLVPVMNALWFHLAGFSAVTLHAQYWALYCSALWALGYTASRRARPLVWVPLLALFAVIPSVTSQLVTLYADIPMALLLMLGVLWLGEWMSTPSSENAPASRLAIAVLLLAGAASTKSEGMSGALAALIGVWVMVIGSRAARPRIRALGLASVALAVMVSPWQLWLAAHHIAGDIPIGRSFNPDYVISHMNRFGPAIRALYNNALSPEWYHVMPLAILVVITSLLAGRGTRREAMFYVLAALLNILAVTWVYIITPINLKWWLATSANRAIDGFVFIGFAAAIALCGQMLPAGPIGLLPRFLSQEVGLRPAASTPRP